MPIEQEVRLYARSDGVVPFTRWYWSLRDEAIQIRVRERLARVRAGNLGDCRSVGGGVQELRIQTGPGLRVYFGRLGSSAVILLSGGDKQSQQRDIQRAHRYWNDYRSRIDG
ncbi:MAG: type II toxin-antitoxin system RelE/ParE family toxin [Deltaproteobacteria bacterium]|nr:type II toxin-antitoxin system RelE/ParE family toxin [Deltaproteobacteria bacterium]